MRLAECRELRNFLSFFALSTIFKIHVFLSPPLNTRAQLVTTNIKSNFIERQPVKIIDVQHALVDYMTLTDTKSSLASFLSILSLRSDLTI